MEVERRLAGWAVAADAPRIWNATLGRLRDEARSAKPPIDETISADVAAVRHYMKSASVGKVAPEPQPWLGGLSEAEFKRHTRENYGF
jgi:hypothetical protein